MTRKCSLCEEEKFESLFYGQNTYCKDCQKEVQKEKYDRKKMERMARENVVNQLSTINITEEQFYKSKLFDKSVRFGEDFY